MALKPKLKVAPELDPQLAELVRRQRSIIAQLEPLLPTIAEGTKLYNQDLNARKAIGAMVPVSGALLPVDGVTYLYTRANHGGGKPDYERLWNQAMILAGPALKATLAKLPGLPAYQAEPGIRHSIVIAPPAAPTLTAIPGGRK